MLETNGKDVFKWKKNGIFKGTYSDNLIQLFTRVAGRKNNNARIYEYMK